MSIKSRFRHETYPYGHPELARPKKRFLTAKEAIRHIQKYYATSEHLWDYYLCPTCRGWHIGKRRKAEVSTTNPQTYPQFQQIAKNAVEREPVNNSSQTQTVDPIIYMA